MIRRLRLPWPDRERSRHGEVVRLLAVSDDRDPALDFERNRAELGRVDGVVGCGDLDPDYLNFLADAFRAPLVYVRGNHDRGANWTAGRGWLPRPLTATIDEIAGVRICGLSWPGDMRWRAARDEGAAWQQAIGVALRSIGRRPLIVASHVPPRGLGDTPEDDYHRGFAGYRWLCRRLKPLVWLHGHTSTAAAQHWRVDWAGTTLVNVTGAVLVELGVSPQAPERRAPAARPRPMQHPAEEAWLEEPPREPAGVGARERPVERS